MYLRKAQRSISGLATYAQIHSMILKGVHRSIPSIDNIKYIIIIIYFISDQITEYESQQCAQQTTDIVLSGYCEVLGSSHLYTMVTCVITYSMVILTWV
jgi:hypothetical protein